MDPACNSTFGVVTLFDQSEAIALFTDGERRYSKLLFGICNEVLRNGKRGKPPKVLPIAVLVGVRYVKRPVTFIQQGFCCTSFDREPL